MYKFYNAAFNLNHLSLFIYNGNYSNIYKNLFVQCTMAPQKSSGLYWSFIGSYF